MKKNLTRGISIMLAVIMLFALTACTKPSGQSSDSGSQEKVKLTIWHSAFIGPNEVDKPESEWAINKVFREFEKANPGVTIEAVFEKDQQLSQNKLKAAVMAKNAPDIINTYSGYTVSNLKDVLLDITDMVPKNDLDTITGWEAVREGMKADGKILGYPSAGGEVGCFIYNKKLVADAGVDLEGAGKPKNAEEFRAAMRKIQDSGVQPIIGNDGGVNGAFMFSFGAWWTQFVGTGRVTSNSTGATKFSDDKAFLKTMNFTYELWRDGIINKDYATNPDPQAAFYSGKAALLITGNWECQNAIDIMGDNAGFYTVPSFDDTVKYPNAAIGGVGQAFVVVNTTKNAQKCVDFLSFFNNKENVIKLTKLMGKIPQRTDITASEIGWDGKPIFEKNMAVASENLMPWNDNAMQPDVCNEYYVQSGLVVIGKETAEECAKILDAKAAEINK